MRQIDLMRHFKAQTIGLLVGLIGSASPAMAQITSNAGDGVLNAPYRGTIDSLRECTFDIGYGEVQTHVEPRVTGSITSSTVDVWIDANDTTWDRSVLRMYEGLDGSGAEVDLTGTSAVSPAMTFPDSDSAKRFSFKAIGAKTFEPQTFTIRFEYRRNGALQTPTTVITVVPVTGSFCGLPGESEAFLPGTSILDVSVGNAQLTVPVGRTAEMIGQTFEEKNDNLGPTSIDLFDVVLPGSAESVFLQNSDHFRLGTSGALKTDWGTPWPGYLVGFWVRSSEPRGPDGLFFDSPAGSSSSFRRFDFIRPLDLSTTHAATQKYTYVSNRVTEIRDQGAIPNIITLQRTAGVVDRITTSDGRGWDVESDPVDGWITVITPDSGKGKRSFTYNSAGRVTQVSNAAGQPMYAFTYLNDANGDPTILNLERRFVDGTMQTAIKHDTSNPSLHIRKEFTASGVFRQFDFAYDTANNLSHRLASIISYDQPNGAGSAYTTTFTHDVENPDGSVVVTQIDLPDGTTIAHEYDSHIGGQTVDFGLRTKSTRTGPNDGSLVTLDIDYEFFFVSGSTRLFNRPRIVKQRDGRGVISEVTFDFEKEAGSTGSVLNRLLSRTGPTITQGFSGTRTPLVTFIYDPTDKVLTRRETTFASGQVRVVEFGYDALLRQTSQTVDPGGKNLVSTSLYCDTQATQDRLTVDPDGYWTRTRFDNDGRVTAVERYLNAGAGNLANACADPTGPVYRVTSSYDVDGRLDQQLTDNKDQDGVSLTPATIATDFAYDRLGRLTLQTLDPGGIGQEWNFDYDWQDGVERQFDTSGRGFAQTLDGRGLVDSRTPLALNETPDNNLTTTFQYDAVGNLRFANSPTGAVAEQVYDDFDRVEESKRNPGPGGGNVITTTFTYDAANNVTRTVVDEATVGVLSDSTAKFDEGGFNYETRQRTTTGVDGTNDPVTEREFDWMGNVTVERSLGDTTVANRVITTIYDTANRVDRVQDSEGGETIFTRDDRGNVTDQTVKLTALDNAVTTTVFDALSRATQITEPEDSIGGRADRIRRYDSRGNLLRESMRDAADTPQMTTVFAYDNAGRRTRSAVLANAASTIDAAAANVTTDRVGDFEFDADGRSTFRHTYNNNAATQLTTSTTYDALGRVDRITDPSASYTDDDYDPTNGRLASRNVFDGVGVRTTTFAYDGHDRVVSQTRLGSPNLTTGFELDGLDRQKRITDPKGIITRTDYDLVGRRIAVVEDEGGSLQRQTDFAYNRLSQLIQQTAKNKANDGTPLADQTTTFRADSLGRLTRTVLPDADVGQHADPANCTDCLRMQYDLAGRMTTRTDQRGLITTQTYDDRGLLLTRTTGTDLDTLDYDALSRVALAQRGTTTVANAVSESVMDYTDLGDLDFETQTIAAGTPRTVDYAHDQAGNRVQTTYPSGEILAFIPTPINQVDSINLNATPLVSYTYQGSLLDQRITTTDDSGGSTSYTQDVFYDSHRRIDGITNSLTTTLGTTILADYLFDYDDNGNVLGQFVLAGTDDFKGDDRAYTVDSLNRLTNTTYFETGETESSAFDLVGNRETHIDRSGSTKTYALANPANEYATINGAAVTYDAAGNLSVDEDGRQYFYDERNRLIEIQDAGNATLASHTYDAFGRRISSDIGGVVTRYYYDGQSVIEERNAGDVRTAFHVNGGQFIDERVTSFDDAAGEFTYLLLNRNFSVAGSGNADGATITRLDFSAAGDFTQPPGGFFFDADEDGDIDLSDHADFVSCITGPGGAAATGCEVHDIDGDGDVDFDDFAVMQQAFGGDGVTPPYFVRIDATFYHDADGDGDVDLDDFVSFEACLSAPDPDAVCLGLHDFDNLGVSDGLIGGLDDFAGFNLCFSGPDVLAPESCLRSTFEGSTPATGSFTLHGRPVDVLADGKTLTFVRARYYDAENGRWLQRDPAGFADGGNLYESFGSNPARFVDPSGKWMARRIAEIVKDKGQLTVGDIQRLGEELNSSPRNQIAKLTPEELQLLQLIGGEAHGNPWTAATLSSGLRARADENYGFLAPPYRYRVQANLSTRRRMLFILLFRQQAFSNYVTDLYRVSRDFNPVHFAAERGIQVGTGVETVTGQDVSRVRAAGEFVVYLALLKGLQAGPRVITQAAGGEVPGATVAGGAASSSGGRVRVYRVEGSPNTRIAVDNNGGVAVIDNTKTLFLNFGNKARADQFFARRLSQGLPDAQIKSFEVPRSFLEDIQAAAVPEAAGRLLPGRPIAVDTTKAPNQFGLRTEQIKALQDAVIQGTGAVEP